MKKPGCSARPSITARMYRKVSGSRKRNAYDAAAEQMLQSVQTLSEDREVLRAIWRLPPAHAELLYLHYYEGYSIEEIVVIMHKNASTLRSRLSRAKELLRKELGKDG